MGNDAAGVCIYMEVYLHCCDLLQATGNNIKEDNVLQVLYHKCANYHRFDAV